MKAKQELIIQVSGKVTESNFETYKELIISQIKSINKDLKTDEDFAEAKKIVKQLDAAEKSMVVAKAEALKQAEEVYKLFDAIDEVSAESKKARLDLDKQIKEQNLKVKQDLIDGASKTCDAIYQKACDTSKDFLLVSPYLIADSDFRDAVHNKSSFSSMQKSLNAVVKKVTENVASETLRISENRKMLTGVDDDYKSAFQDPKALLVMSKELLNETIQKRIAVHEADELKREKEEAEKKSTAAEVKKTEVSQVAEKPQLPTHSHVAYKGSRKKSVAIQEQTAGSINDTQEKENFVLKVTTKIEMFCTIDEVKEMAKAYAETGDVIEVHLSRPKN